MLKFDKTSLDMLSIPKKTAQLLLAAPEACFKLYLFAQLYPDGDMDTLASATGLQKDQIMSACDWLVEHGAARIEGDTFILLAAEPAGIVNSPVYEDGDLMAIVCHLLGKPELSHRECNKLSELITTYELPKEVIPILVEYCMLNSTNGKTTMTKIHSQGVIWAQSNINTIERASQLLNEDDVISEDIFGLFKLMGWRRLPTEPEKAMYNSWINKGYTFDAIRSAIPATTASAAPSMSYLNSIIENLEREHLYTTKEITEHFARRSADDKRIKELLRLIGARSLTVTPTQRDLFDGWGEAGIAPDMILFAAERTAMSGYTRFGDINNTLANWREKGFFNIADVEAHIEAQRLEMQNTIEMFSRAGIKKGISAGDIRLLKKFTEEMGFSPDIVLYAAECAYGLASPLKAMEKILTRWKERGVKTVEDAAAENAAFFAGRTTGASFKQREGTEISSLEF